MAWISVHEQVIGMKLRELSKCIGCSQKEALGILVSLWLWGINNATKDGELRGSDKNDIKDALSIGLSAGLSPGKIVDCLIEKHWIDYGDGVYILHDWDTWQEQWYKALDRRAYDANRKREERKRKYKDCPQDIPSDCTPENPVQPLPSPSPSPKRNRKPSPNQTEDIDCIFNFYCETFNGYYEQLTLTDKRKKNIAARLKRYDVDMIKKAISNIRQSKWHLGEDEKNTKFYATIDFLMRSDEQIETWINYKPKISGNKNTNKALELYSKAKAEEEGEPVW